MKIETIPEKEVCRVCGKDLSEENQDTLIDKETGERFAYCEPCFQEHIIKRIVSRAYNQKNR